MPYRVIKTFWLKEGIARKPGDWLSEDDINEIPEKIRSRRLDVMISQGMIRMEDSPEQQLVAAKKTIAELEPKEKVPGFDSQMRSKKKNKSTKDSEPKKKGRPKK